MNKNIIIKCILKYIPIYLLALFFVAMRQYILSFSGLFIGEILAILNVEEHILPEFLLKYVDGGSLKDSITSLAVIYIVISSISVFSAFLSRVLRNFFHEKLLTSLSVSFYSHVINIHKSEYSKRSTGDIIQRNINDCKRIANIFRMSVYELFKMIITASVLLMQIYRLDQTIFVISLFASSACLITSAYYGYFKIKDKEIQSSVYYSALNSTIQQSLTNYSLVKSFANEDYEYEKFKKINDSKEKNNLYINNTHCKYWLISDTLNSLYIVSCLTLMAILFFDGNMALPTISALVVIITSLLYNFSQLINYITSFVKTFISVKRINEYFRIENEYTSDGMVEKEIVGDIEFKNVYMKYDKEYALKDISFSIKKGQTLGIVGKSGSGKTSIVNLLTRLDEYEKGSILIDDVELKDYKKQFIRNSIGVVLQDAFIFSKTIKENLLILTDNDRIDLDMYLKRVSLDEDISKFEKGMDTIVGERGVTLSGGQRQRMSLLRTIIKNKNILILDDTLSAVDNIVAKEIKETLKKEKSSIIIISHNLMNVKDADKIIVLDDGEIVDSGTHDELIQKEGFYSNVWKLQQLIKEGE